MKKRIFLAFIFSCSVAQTAMVPFAFWKKQDNHLDASWTPQWSSLKAYWRMDGAVGAIPMSGVLSDQFTTSNATANGAGMSYVTGLIYQGVSFDNAHYFTIPATAPANVCTNMTLSFWVKWNAPTSPTWAALMTSWNGCGSDAAWSLQQNNNTKKISVAVNTTAGFNQGLYSVGAPLDGSWHHIALTVAASGAGVLYIDGAQDATTTFNIGSGICSPTAPMTFGGTSCSSPMGSGGILDEIAIWNTVLTATEVSTIYTRQKSGT